MRIPSRCLTTLERALARARYDADFRGQVLEAGRLVQAAYRLSAPEWQRLGAEVARLEQTPAGFTRHRTTGQAAAVLSHPPQSGSAGQRSRDFPDRPTHTELPP